MSFLFLSIGLLSLVQAQVTKVNGRLARESGAAGADVTAVQVTPDGSWAVWYADADADEVFEIYSRPTDGSLPVRKLSAGGDARVWGEALFDIDPTGARVLFHDDPTATGAYELFSVPVDGSAPAVR